MDNMKCLICGMNITANSYNLNNSTFINENEKENIINCPFCGVSKEYIDNQRGIYDIANLYPFLTFSLALSLNQSTYIHILLFKLNPLEQNTSVCSKSSNSSIVFTELFVKIFSIFSPTFLYAIKITVYLLDMLIPPCYYINYLYYDNIFKKKLIYHIKYLLGKDTLTFCFSLFLNTIRMNSPLLILILHYQFIQVASNSFEDYLKMG